MKILDTIFQIMSSYASTGMDGPFSPKSSLSWVTPLLIVVGLSLVPWVLFLWILSFVRCHTIYPTSDGAGDDATKQSDGTGQNDS